MTDTLDLIDEWGPEKIVTVSDRRLGYGAVLVLDNTARGAGKGGTRMSPTVSVAEISRLARTMTWKWAGIDVLLGGAKAGIRFDPMSPRKEEVLRSFARRLSNEIPREYVFGLDMGLSEDDAAIIVDELGTGSAVGTPNALGGVAYDRLGITGFGVAEAADAAQQRTGDTLIAKSVSIHGFGAVGQAAALRMQELGATVTHVATRYGSIHDPNGLDCEAIIRLARDRGESFVLDGDFNVLDAELALTAHVDVLIPAAIQDVITRDNVQGVTADLIVEGANLPISPEAADILRARGATIVPDFIANAGGALAAAHAMDARNSVFAPNTDAIFTDTSNRIRKNVQTVLDQAERDSADTKVTARSIAQQRVRAAMTARGQLPR